MNFSQDSRLPTGLRNINRRTRRTFQPSFFDRIKNYFGVGNTYNSFGGKKYTKKNKVKKIKKSKKAKSKKN